MSHGNHEATLSTRLSAGQAIWSVLSWGEEELVPWTVQRAETELAATTTYWRDWLATLSDDPAFAPDLLSHAITLKLLTYAPTGSPVAAPTSSLPERLGGERNWDYRYAWVRDAALCISVLCQLGDLDTGRRYLDCLATYGSSTESPLQVVYGIDGALNLPEHKRWDLAGYAHSRPVREGNRACTQRQLDSLGFFVDSALTYLTCGGEWTEDHWQMVHRAADYTADHWRLPDSGLWEHVAERHYVSSKVMSWVALERACRIAEHIGEPGRIARWREAQVEIHADVLHQGWNEQRQAFTECYEDETLDASALLIPLMGFLPIDDPHVIATIERIQAELMVDGFIYRQRSAIDGEVDGREGAFLPCTCWMAMVLAMAGRTDGAEALLAQVAAAAGEKGILSEQIDPADRSFLGNLPLVFTHAEYLRARLVLSRHADAESCASPARQAF
jgi:GH15 family glucan-1,4-alpha-glucosidase